MPLGHNNKNQNNPPQRSKAPFNPFWIYLIIGVSLFGLLFIKPSKAQKELSWNEFKAYATENAFSKITVDRQNLTAVGTVADNKLSEVFSRQEIRRIGNTTPRSNTVEYEVVTQIPSVDRFSEFTDGQEISAEIVYAARSFPWGSILLNTIPFLLLIFFWIYIMRRMSAQSSKGGGGIFSVGKSKAKLYDRAKVNVTFKDVAGLNEAKQEVKEIVDFLREPEQFTRLGGKIPKGVLLVGPPGTGKTLIAKAVAGEAHVPFFSMSGSDFVEMFVGVGASRVRDLFTQAKEKSPCIVFIDEIDAVGRARGKSSNLGGNDERESTLNQLLTEMDGFDSNSGVIVMAATNRVDVLDSALLRAGRFDRQISVDLPDINDRKEIFGVHMKGLKLSNDVDVELLARQTPGFSGADIANVCNEAALIAARGKKKAIDKEDFNNAVDRIIGGLEKKSRIITQEERSSIAIHEAGHATVSWMLQYGNPLVKVTIVPRGKALGAAWYMPEERQITHEQVLLDEMCSLLGGRAAEELFLNRISTGAANDLERVTKLARAMVTYYGMSEKLPNINYYDPQDEYGFSKPYSDKTSELIDAEVLRIINEQYERAKSILREHVEGHHQIADQLLDKEVIYTEDVERILGKRAWESRADALAREDAEQKSKEADTKDTEGNSNAQSVTPGETEEAPKENRPLPPPIDPRLLEPR